MQHFNSLKFILPNIKVNIFSTMVLSEIIRFFKYDRLILCCVLSQFHLTQRDGQPVLGPKNVET